MGRTAWWGWKYVGWILLVLFVVVFVVQPMAASYLVRNQKLQGSTIRYLLWTEYMVMYLGIGFAALWIFFVGSTFASFLNVVAWRVPRGYSILGYSACPVCNVKLSFGDNFPVLGWLKSGGRCSACHLPISPRYLIVEIVLGAIFFIAGFALFLSAGGIVPFVSRPPSETPLAGLLLNPQLEFVLILFLHLIAIMSIFTFGLIEVERKRVPTSVYGVAILILVLVATIWPQSLVVPFDFPFANVDVPMGRWQALASLIAGALSGWFFGILLVQMSRSLKGLANAQWFLSPQIYLGLCLVGLIGGWQSVLVVGVSWFDFRLAVLMKMSERKNVAKTDSNDLNFCGILLLPHVRLLIVMLIHLATWRWFELIAK